MTRSGPSTTARRRRTAPLLALAVAVSGALVGGTAPGAVAGPGVSQHGTLSSADGVLPARNQCGSYTFAYEVTPPDGIWGLEFFVTDPRGNVVASQVALLDYSPPSAVLPFTLCRNNTRAGVFTLSAKLSVDDGTGEVTSYPMTPATFTLARPPRTTSPQALAKKKAALKRAAQKKAAQEKAAQQRRAEQRRR